MTVLPPYQGIDPIVRLAKISDIIRDQALTLEAVAAQGSLTPGIVGTAVAVMKSCADQIASPPDEAEAADAATETLSQELARFAQAFGEEPGGSYSFDPQEVRALAVIFAAMTHQAVRLETAAEIHGGGAPAYEAKGDVIYPDIFAPKGETS